MSFTQKIKKAGAGAMIAASTLAPPAIVLSLVSDDVDAQQSNNLLDNPKANTGANLTGAASETLDPYLKYLNVNAGTVTYSFDTKLDHYPRDATLHGVGNVTGVGNLLYQGNVTNFQFGGKSFSGAVFKYDGVPMHTLLGLNRNTDCLVGQRNYLIVNVNPEGQGYIVANTGDIPPGPLKNAKSDRLPPEPYDPNAQAFVFKQGPDGPYLLHNLPGGGERLVIDRNYSPNMPDDGRATQMKADSAASASGFFDGEWTAVGKNNEYYLVIVAANTVVGAYPTKKNSFYVTPKLAKAMANMDQTQGQNSQQK